MVQSVTVVGAGLAGSECALQLAKRGVRVTLLEQRPVHASPAEHQATPDRQALAGYGGWEHPELHGNFDGWVQYRKLLPAEVVR